MADFFVKLESKQLRLFYVNNKPLEDSSVQFQLGEADPQQVSIFVASSTRSFSLPIPLSDSRSPNLVAYQTLKFPQQSPPRPQQPKCTRFMIGFSLSELITRLLHGISTKKRFVFFYPRNNLLLVLAS